MPLLVPLNTLLTVFKHTHTHIKVTPTLMLCLYTFERFFVVEDTILHTCQSSSGGHKEESEQGLMSQPVLDEFWEMATSEMLSVLRHHCVRESSHFITY